MVTRLLAQAVDDTGEGANALDNIFAVLREYSSAGDMDDLTILRPTGIPDKTVGKAMMGERV